MPTEAQWNDIIRGVGGIAAAVIILMYLKFFFGGSDD